MSEKNKINQILKEKNDLQKNLNNLLDPMSRKSMLTIHHRNELNKKNKKITDLEKKLYEFKYTFQKLKEENENLNLSLNKTGCFSLEFENCLNSSNSNINEKLINNQLSLINVHDEKEKISHLKKITEKLSKENIKLKNDLILANSVSEGNSPQKPGNLPNDFQCKIFI